MDRTDLGMVGILVFDDVEVLDLCRPFEDFTTARSAGIVGADEPQRDTGGRFATRNE